MLALFLRTTHHLWPAVQPQEFPTLPVVPQQKKLNLNSTCSIHSWNFEKQGSGYPLREGFQKKTIESVSMLIPPSDPTPLYCERLRLFFYAMFFGLLGLFGTLWNRFCNILGKFWSKQRERRTVKIWQINGQRVDFDGQINLKIYEI